MSSLRMRVLEYIHANGNHMTYQDVAAGLKENPQRVRGALGDASNEGYLSFGRDDFTGRGGYSLTSKGTARIVNGHQTINGKQASENKAASDAREAAAHVMSAPEAMPEPDPVLLASANRWLSEQNDKLQKRIDVLETSREDMRKLIAGKIEVIAKLEKEVAELQDNTADELVGTVANLMADNAALRKQAADACADLEEAQRGLMVGATLANSALMKKPIGYAHVWDGGFQQFDSEEAARADIEKSIKQMESMDCASHLCAILNTAELSVKWVRS